MAALRGALVGFGQVAEKAHAPALSGASGLSIEAVADSSPERRQAAAFAFPRAKTYDSLEALLAGHSGLDFAVIATPPSAHGTQALAALRAGLHVLCEKPLSMRLDELEAIKREALKTALAVCTVHNWAYSPQWKKVFALLSEGALGQVRHAELHALRTKPAGSSTAEDWRRDAKVAGGGVLVDHGWHNLYLLRRALPEAPSRVTGRLSPREALDEEATVFLEYPEATALLHLSWRSSLRRNAALFYGTKGTLELNDDHLLLRRESLPAERFDFAQPLSAASAHPDWTAELISDFGTAVADPKHSLRNIEEAAFCLRLINRVYASVRVGRNPLRAAFAK